MEQFILDEIIEYLEANPNADAVQVIKERYIKATDQLERIYHSSGGIYNGEPCNGFYDVMKRILNVDI